LDIDQDGKVLYGDLGEYVKPRELPRFEALQLVVSSPPDQQAQPRSRSRSPANRVTFADQEESKADSSTGSPIKKTGILQQLQQSNTSIRVYSP